MIKTIQAYECFCHCKHVWISKTEPKRCAKCKSRKWNDSSYVEAPKVIEETDEIFPEPVHETKESPKRTTGSKSCPECGAIKGGHQRKCSKRRK